MMQMEIFVSLHSINLNYFYFITKVITVIILILFKDKCYLKKKKKSEFTKYLAEKIVLENFQELIVDNKYKNSG